MGLKEPVWRQFGGRSRCRAKLSSIVYETLQNTPAVLKNVTYVGINHIRAQFHTIYVLLYCYTFHHDYKSCLAYIETIQQNMKVHHRLNRTMHRLLLSTDPYDNTSYTNHALVKTSTFTSTLSGLIAST